MSFKILIVIMMARFLIGEKGAFAVDTPVNVEKEYQEAVDQFESLKKNLNPSLVLLFEEGQKTRIQGLHRHQRKLKSAYAQLKEKKEYWDKVYRLYHDLIDNYREIYPEISDDESQELKKEAGILSAGLIKGIGELQQRYKIGTFPIIHNLLIDVGFKKRGACKHWAEDLLTLIDSWEHPHYTSYWAEAHPGNILEHNVAVLAPKNTSFEKGILIDPWRTAGKPFWIRVSQDSHPWRQWGGYEPK